MEKEKDQGEELVEIDEKGNPVEENAQKEPKLKMTTSRKIKWTIQFIFTCFLFVVIYYCIKTMLPTTSRSVFDSTVLKNKKLKNRIIFGAIVDEAYQSTESDEKGIRNYEKLAKNDVALIVTGARIINKNLNSPVRIDIDDHQEELKKLAEAVHKYNTSILLQLVHPGLASTSEEVLSPSGGKAFFSDKSKAMTKEDILEVEKNFVEAAKKAKIMGFDGVEIHANHLSLVSTFLSKKYNKRDDEYGGTDEKRAQFLVEIISKIRKEVGDDMIISVKLDSEDEEHGFDEKGFLTAGKLAEENGADLIEVSGTNYDRAGEIIFFEKAKKLAETVKIPVVCIGGIKSYENSQYVLKNSKVEYIGIVRELAKNPELIKEWSKNK